MTPSASVFGRQFCRQHATLLAILFVSIAFIGVLFRFLPVNARTPLIAADCSYQLWIPVLMIAVKFTFAEHADLSARDSAFPPRLFTLPVTTQTLVAWPLLLGSIIVAIAWFAEYLLILRQCGITMPLAWPGFMLAAMFAWSIAIVWTPFWLPWMRIVIGVIVVPMIDVLTLSAISSDVSEIVVCIGLCVAIAGAYSVASAGSVVAC